MAPLLISPARFGRCAPCEGRAYMTLAILFRRVVDEGDCTLECDQKIQGL
jgi:hypothetical protein